MKPLEGVRVVEAASYVSGPFAAMMLADLGADVVKVEPPRGDPYRRFGRSHGDSSLFFRASNQNKTNVALDLRSPEGIEALFELLADADVLISNWRPSVAPSMGLDDETIRSRFPRLIWVRVSGYGQDGPRADMPAYDSIIQSRSGVLLSGTDAPLGANNIVADKVTAMTAAQTATAALLHRGTDGPGSICDVAMVDAMAYFYGCDVSAGHRVVGARPDEEVGRRLNDDLSHPTADSFITLAPVSGKQIRRCLEAVGRADAWDQVIANPEHVFTELVAVVCPELLKRTTAEWEAIMERADVPAAGVKHFDEHIADVQTVHNGTYIPVTDNALGEFLQVRFPGFFDGKPVDVDRKPAPTLPSA